VNTSVENKAKSEVWGWRGKLAVLLGKYGFVIAMSSIVVHDFVAMDQCTTE